MSIIGVTGNLRRYLTISKEGIMTIFKKEMKENFENYRSVSLF